MVLRLGLCMRPNKNWCIRVKFTWNQHWSKACCQASHKPISEPMMTEFILKHKCITRFQWVKLWTCAIHLPTCTLNPMVTRDVIPKRGATLLASSGRQTTGHLRVPHSVMRCLVSRGGSTDRFTRARHSWSRSRWRVTALTPNTNWLLG